MQWIPTLLLLIVLQGATMDPGDNLRKARRELRPPLPSTSVRVLKYAASGDWERLVASAAFLKSFVTALGEVVEQDLHRDLCQAITIRSRSGVEHAVSAILYWDLHVLLDDVAALEPVSPGTVKSNVLRSEKDYRVLRTFFLHRDKGKEIDAAISRLFRQLIELIPLDRRTLKESAAWQEDFNSTASTLFKILSAATLVTKEGS